MDLSDFAARQPALEPERFFAGELEGWGLEFGPLGGIGRRLQVTASGRFDEATQTLNLEETYRFDDGHVDRLEWRIRKLADRRYEVKRRDAIPGGFLQEHVLHGTAPDGSTVAMPACIVAKVADGRITRMHEYLDPVGVRALSA